MVGAMSSYLLNRNRSDANISNVCNKLCFKSQANGFTVMPKMLQSMSDFCVGVVSFDRCLSLSALL